MSQPALTCAAHRAIAVLQEKWVMGIIWELLKGKCGFNELARRVGGCNSATLTQRLEQLEHMQLITKATDSDVTGKLARSIYDLTDAGRELQVVLNAIESWGRAHLPSDEDAATEVATKY